MCKKFKIVVLVFLIAFGVVCSKRKVGAYQRGSACVTTIVDGKDKFMCSSPDTSKPNIGCQQLDPYSILGIIKIGDDCEKCNPDAITQAAALSLQGGPTCTISVPMSVSIENPFCWTFGVCTCFSITDGSACYVTLNWTEIQYVPAPVYGPCP